MSIVAGSVYLAHVVPRYTATAVVLIGSAKDKTGLSASIADLTYDAGAIDSQLEILKSEGLAQTVMTDLKLEASSMPQQPPSLPEEVQVDETSIDAQARFATPAGHRRRPRPRRRRRSGAPSSPSWRPASMSGASGAATSLISIIRRQTVWPPPSSPTPSLRATSTISSKRASLQ